MPTFLKASQRIMNLIAIIGAGLLVGVALIIIIPEGTFTLYKAYETEVAYELARGNKVPVENKTQLLLGVTLVGGFLVMLFID